MILEILGITVGILSVVASILVIACVMLRCPHCRRWHDSLEDDAHCAQEHGIKPPPQ